MLFFGRLKRRFNSRDAVTETAFHRRNAVTHCPIEAASMWVTKRLTACAC